MYDNVTASRLNPVYSVHMRTKTIDNMHLHNVVTGLKLSEQKNQIAQKATVTLMNVTDSSGRLLEDYLGVLDAIIIYANDGEAVDEVFRGVTWTKRYTNDSKKYITLICYDYLIYFQKTEESKYFEAGIQTESICAQLCLDKGVEMVYDYESIENKKLPLSGKLSDIFLSDLLDEVEKKTGKKYVMRMDKNVVYIKNIGSNTKIYEVKRKENAISAQSELSMDDVITQVIITGTADDDGRVPIEQTLTGDTDTYGTIQKIIKKGADEDDDSVEDAEYYLDEYGEPKLTFDIEAIDIPFVHKGDKIKVVAGDMTMLYYAVSITHDALQKTMQLTLELYEDSSSDTDSSGDIYQGMELTLDYAPIYISSDATSIATHVTGIYYIYDGIEYYGRYRITDSASLCGVKPINENVVGWIDKEYLN